MRHCRRDLHPHSSCRYGCGWSTHAYEVWWTRGADQVRGGFHESLHLDATPTDESRRARLHPRQIFAYAHATELGWSRPARQCRSARTELSSYRATSVTTGSTERKWRPTAHRLMTTSSSTIRHSHCFALRRLTLSAGSSAGESKPTRSMTVFRSSSVRSVGGFKESLPSKLPLTSNSHMHLLEAALGLVRTRRPPLLVDSRDGNRPVGTGAVDRSRLRHYRRIFRPGLAAPAHADPDSSSRDINSNGPALPPAVRRPSP